jgi:hypothetical protein
VNMRDHGIAEEGLWVGHPADPTKRSLWHSCIAACKNSEHKSHQTFRAAPITFSSLHFGARKLSQHE